MNHFRKNKLSRRTLLQGLGISSLLSPLIPLLNAGGQELGFPKRLLLFFSPDGTASVDHGGALLDWKPTGTETDFTLQATHAPLTALQSRLVIPYGLSMSAGGAGQEHAFGMAGLWTGASLHPPHDGFDFDGGNGQRTGWGSGPSIDQVIAAQFGSEMPYERAADDVSPETPYRTLEFGVQCAEPHSMHRMIYKADKQPIHPETNPKAAFDRLFGGLNVDPTTEPTGPDPLALRKTASLDFLMTEVERLRTQVGKEEYLKVEAHLEGLRALKRRVGGAAPAPSQGCTIPEVPAGTTSMWENSTAFPSECQSMIALAVHALSCDLTRVASLQLSRGFSNIVHAGQTQGHHTISHLDGDNRPALLQIDQFYAQQFASLLAALDSVQEGSGTLLDNTLVVWGREMGQTNHKMSPLNLILAGGARSGLRTGRFLDVGNQRHATLLVSIAQLMGASLTSFGNIDMDTGPLAGIA